ncbi:MAG: serine hydrolase domain-containing protein [Gemmatimonadales bacterium]|nr:serine hydrolase domain-containing protein [Gemmatimonadales bacterium]
MSRLALAVLVLWTQKAAAQAAILGATPARDGRFPAARAAIDSGIARRVFPGAVLLVLSNTQTLDRTAAGTLDTTRRSPRPSASGTMWDLASLSKLLGPVSVAARLVDRGRLDLDAPVHRYVPAFRGTVRDGITVRMLLRHTSGLRPFLRLWTVAATPGAGWDLVLNDALVRRPDSAALYSDLNALLLQRVVERVGGAPLAVLVAREVAQPLGLRSLRYRPPPALRARAAPTRGPGASDGMPPTRGTVHDENAAFLGGVAGHAGLFATGDDVARFARAWLRLARRAQGLPVRGRDAADRWLRPATVATFLERTAAGGTRRLGWDSPDSAAIARGEVGSYGSGLSPLAFGHTGFTGTFVWIDPARDRALVLLTNRTYFGRDDASAAGMREVRRGVSAAVAP